MGATVHPLYDAWRNMKRRCYGDYKNSKYYKNYGGRGISVCAEWLNDFMTFYNWAINNGWVTGLTIDRADNEGNYEPSNCRWVNRAFQLRNRRNNRMVTYKYLTMTAKDWAGALSISYAAFRKRLNKWGDDERAVSEPLHTNYVR